MRNNNPLQKEFLDFQSLIDGGLISTEAVSKLKLKQPPATGQETYQYLTSVKQHENIRTYKEILRWYNNKVVVPTLEAMQKMVNFSHSKVIDLLKLGCILHNHANICLHKATTAKFYPFTDRDNDLQGKNVKAW